MISHPELKGKMKKYIEDLDKNVSQEFEGSFSKESFLRDLEKTHDLRLKAEGLCNKLLPQVERLLDNENGDFHKIYATYRKEGIYPKVLRFQETALELTAGLKTLSSHLSSDFSSSSSDLPGQLETLKMQGQRHLVDIEINLESLLIELLKIGNFLRHEAKYYSNKKGRFKYGDNLLPLLQSYTEKVQNTFSAIGEEIFEALSDIYDLDENLYAGVDKLIAMQKSTRDLVD